MLCYEKGFLTEACEIDRKNKTVGNDDQKEFFYILYNAFAFIINLKDENVEIVRNLTYACSIFLYAIHVYAFQGIFACMNSIW